MQLARQYLIWRAAKINKSWQLDVIIKCHKYCQINIIRASQYVFEYIEHAMRDMKGPRDIYPIMMRVLGGNFIIKPLLRQEINEYITSNSLPELLQEVYTCIDRYRSAMTRYINAYNEFTSSWSEDWYDYISNRSLYYLFVLCHYLYIEHAILLQLIKLLNVRKTIRLKLEHDYINYELDLSNNSVVLVESPIYHPLMVCTYMIPMIYDNECKKLRLPHYISQFPMSHDQYGSNWEIVFKKNRPIDTSVPWLTANLPINKEKVVNTDLPFNQQLLQLLMLISEAVNGDSYISNSS